MARGNFTTGAQRRQARYDKIWAEAKLNPPTCACYHRVAWGCDNSCAADAVAIMQVAEGKRAAREATRHLNGEG